LSLEREVVADGYSTASVGGAERWQRVRRVYPARLCFWSTPMASGFRGSILT